MTKNAPQYIFGRHAAAEALAAKVPIQKAYVSSRLLEKGTDKRLSRLVSDLEKAHVQVESISNRQLEGLAKHASHQGILLEVAPYPYASLEEILKSCEGQKDALVIVLDHITDEGNLGAIARTAEVVGALGLIIPNARTASVGAGAYKTSAGAVAYLPVVQVSNLAYSLETLKDHGFWVVGATEHAENNIWEAPLSGRIVLVMGSEEKGISPLLLNQCDFLAKLPQTGKIESLNVAQATTVFAYEWLRQCSF